MLSVRRTTDLLICEHCHLVLFLQVLVQKWNKQRQKLKWTSVKLIMQKYWNVAADKSPLGVKLLDLIECILEVKIKKKKHLIRLT